MTTESRWSKRRKITILFVLPVLLFVLIFGVYNIIWFRYVDRAFSPFLENEKLEQVFICGAGGKYYEYRDSENGYIVQIGIQPYLRFGGTISVSTTSQRLNNFNGEFIVFHSSIRIQQLLVLGLGENLPNHSYSMGSAVDRNGQPLGRHPNDSEEFYQEWLLLYERFNEDVMELIDYFKVFFGEVILL
jgi:hypothetical protein